MPVGPARAYAAYTTPEAVQAELPPRIQAADLDPALVEQVIDSSSNRLDAALARYYRLPALPRFADGTVAPADADPTLIYLPAEFERITRYWSVAELMVRLLDMRQEEGAPKSWFETEADAALDLLKKGDSFPSYPFLHPDGRPYFVTLADGSPLYGMHPLSAGRRLRYSYPELEFADNIDAGRWGRRRGTR